MTELTARYFTEDEILNILNENNIPLTLVNEFTSFIEKNLIEIIETNDFEDFEIKPNVISEVTEFIIKYDNELKKGHGKEWSKYYASNFEDHVNAFYDTYKKIKEIDSVLALEELNIHCQHNGGDKLYTKHFIYSIENGDWYQNPDRMAAIYSKIYKDEINKGKSHLFSHYYADLMADEKTEENACYIEAMEYEKSINDGKSENYAGIYATKMTDFIFDSFSNYEKAINDPMYLLKKQEIEKSMIYIK